MRQRCVHRRTKFGNSLRAMLAQALRRCSRKPLLFSPCLSCSQSYLQAASDGPAGHSLDPSANYSSPKFRSRNQSYMRAVSTLSQASCVSQVGSLRPPTLP